MTQTAPKRAYHSPLREQRAQETRDRVIAAAGDLFNLHGFAGTTMSAIAQKAGVSVESVHAVGTKGSLLVEAYTRRTADADGAADGVPGDGDLDTLVERQTATNERSSGLWQSLRAAATVEPSVATALETVLERRREGYLAAVDRLVEAGHMNGKPELRQRYAAALAVCLSPETYHQLVHDWGLGHDEYATWLRRAIIGIGQV